MDLSKLEEKIGYQFKDRQLAITALTHSSYANEHGRHDCEYNERMEFLGDAVLEVISSDHLYHNYPHIHNGHNTSQDHFLQLLKVSYFQLFLRSKHRIVYYMSYCFLQLSFT